MSSSEFVLKEFRSTGRQSLETVLKHEKNIRIIEKCIHKSAQSIESDYKEKYNKVLYQTIGDIISGIKLNEIVSNIKNGFVGWDHPVFMKVKNRIEEHDDFIINPFEVEEGVTECHAIVDGKTCGSKRVFTYSKQVRSSDEPMTTFAKCVKCKAQWTYSG